MDTAFSLLIKLVLIIIFFSFLNSILSSVSKKKKHGSFFGIKNILSNITDTKNDFQYERKSFLLSIPERRFFEKLQEIIPEGYVVFPQVLLSSIVYASSLKKDFWAHQNKINRKTVDFVIFEKEYLKPVIVIEYDGKSHEREDRQARDRFVDKVLEVSKIEIIHIKHRQNINFEEIEDKIKGLLVADKKV
ncbi:MAG: hypothetical protein CO137_00880 [Candidatus Magasanikbacteria bacterium CG_4_9_14_3_um_filter_32_9]|uniref:DUF2726 domain-containing protein n=1 Tax=Candidatus Magasanikbacteria bacterium CG_4_9_14_3_um_filter_32_9 TaxID=1974644 RepID=A0A2M7Z7M0_9BACT|nr:MAG: hypothetical protein CO137_00880 [Candidatus Magasanikbacteria bacterium CG_4_9_14_3_um_filter_32_9]